MLPISRRALMAGSAATAAFPQHCSKNEPSSYLEENYSPSPTLADLAQMQDLAMQAEEAYAAYDRAAGQSDELADPLFTAFMDLERRTRHVPAQSIEGALFKLRHIMGDGVFDDVEPWLAEPLEMLADDLARIGGAQ